MILIEVFLKGKSHTITKGDRYPRPKSLSQKKRGIILSASTSAAPNEHLWQLGKFQVNRTENVEVVRTSLF